MLEEKAMASKIEWAATAALAVQLYIFGELIHDPYFAMFLNSLSSALLGSILWTFANEEEQGDQSGTEHLQHVLKQAANAAVQNLKESYQREKECTELFVRDRGQVDSEFG